ncbi:hypothetical protein PAPYR_559 [Paratrimastix pyriformis]|uniref:Uncharacterized protein n=1 Tax=Paratrimastix pyriformis TaxID=342808 RepID=A0ABQ8UTY3_9EUKA|nr:hypothetical protein PAPYR_559 [Paratrimastix pyriformis]
MWCKRALCVSVSPRAAWAKARLVRRDLVCDLVCDLAEEEAYQELNRARAALQECETNLRSKRDQQSQPQLTPPPSITRSCRTQSQPQLTLTRPHP